MKSLKLILTALLLASVALPGFSQVVRKKDKKETKDSSTGVTFRMKEFYEETPESEANLMWMKVIYRQLDLNQIENMPLYYPEEPTENQQSLFRLIMKLLTAGELKAYEYLDGREVFNEQYQIKVGETLDRFHIIYKEAKGSTEKNPKYEVEESDVPSNEVLSYYIIERWEFNSNENRMKSTVEAICPVLHRSDDFGGEPIRYPMFWLKLADIRPYLTQQNIFVDDDNNLAKYTFDDFFQLGMYKGEIYKTRNLRNRTLMQMFPDPDDLKHAQDSIENRLKAFDKDLWVPTREELDARREAEEAARLRAEGKSDDIVVKDRDGGDSNDTDEVAAEPEETTKSAKNKRSSSKSSKKETTKKETTKKDADKKKKAKPKKPAGTSSKSNAVRSVRRTK